MAAIVPAFASAQCMAVGRFGEAHSAQASARRQTAVELPGGLHPVRAGTCRYAPVRVGPIWKTAVFRAAMKTFTEK
jgi:hypothetical protein